MATALEDGPLVHRHGCHVELDAQPISIDWLGTTAAVTLGDGSVRWIDDEAQIGKAEVHAGAILSACRHPDGASIVTGGDDGRVCRLFPNGIVEELGNFPRKWVEHLVSSSTSNLIVAGVGREAVVWSNGAQEPSHRYSVGSSIGGLALDQKGKRLAISHYGGTTLLYGTNPASGRVALNWVGSHLACTLSADGAFLITALQETGLHGWQLTEMRDMRMPGYAAKTRSFSWNKRGKWLATSGSAGAILWPFEGKNGPMGKAPLIRAEHKAAVVTRVAFHPREDVLAVGYSDGVIILARLEDDATLLIEEAGANVTTLAWNDAGTRLGWGGDDGRIGILVMEGRE